MFTAAISSIARAARKLQRHPLKTNGTGLARRPTEDSMTLHPLS